MRGRGSQLGKFERMYCFNDPIPISSVAYEFLIFFTWINFREYPLLKNFASINFREKPKNSRNRKILSMRKLIHVR